MVSEVVHPCSENNSKSNVVAVAAVAVYDILPWQPFGVVAFASVASPSFAVASSVAASSGTPEDSYHPSFADSCPPSQAYHPYQALPPSQKRHPLQKWN